jgi:uncharacterized protein
MARAWHVWQNRVRIDETPLGKGVFAKRHFRRGQVVGVIQGKVIDDPHYGSMYCMDLGGTRSLEPIAPFRYLNHSCEPNCELFIWTYLEDSTPAKQLFLEALRAIEPEEELTIDYAWSPEAAIPCLCGCRSCRGWVVDPDQLNVLLAGRVPIADKVLNVETIVG